MTNANDNLPREFGKYHLIEAIAAGGMAELYRAKLYGAGGFEKDLAIKKVLPQLIRDEAFVQMFMDEAMITVTLNHGNIVSVIDFGELEGEYYLVMEYVDGINLQILIKKSQEISNPIPVPIACYLALNICRGLDYAHRKVGADGKPLEIVHR
ncbi:serine/threonine protein kinase, partial [Myxococcota bacterium]